jgi:DNA-binding response OmpR family regulator
MDNQLKSNAPAQPAIVFVTADEASCADLIAEFTTKGYEINVVKDGTKAVGLPAIKPKTWKPSIFFIDLVIPGDSGFFVTKLVRDRYPDKKIPIILFAQHIAPEDKMESAQLGALGLLSKPVNVDAVREMLDKERARRAKADNGGMAV